MGFTSVNQPFWDIPPWLWKSPQKMHQFAQSQLPKWRYFRFRCKESHRRATCREAASKQVVQPCACHLPMMGWSKKLEMDWTLPKIRKTYDLIWYPSLGKNPVKHQFDILLRQFQKIPGYLSILDNHGPGAKFWGTSSSDFNASSIPICCGFLKNRWLPQ